MQLTERPKITVYADISCPFCFALHERLIALDALHLVQWRTIEHAPGANSSIRDARQIEQLSEEYRLVLKRAKDVKVTNPGFIPNTALVNQYLHHLSEQYPDKIDDIRTLIYRALWQKSQDISNRDVLLQLLAEHGYEVKGIGPDASDTLSRWQRKWQFADFDQRIPVMLRDHTEVMLGLQHKETIGTFVSFGEVQEMQDGNICQFISKDVIMVLCKDEHRAMLLTLAEGENTTLIFFDDQQSLLSELRKNKPDLVLLDEHTENCFGLCSEVKDLNNFRDMPVVVMSDNIQRDQEKHAFKSGAVDYICIKNQARALFSRLKNHINCKHRMDILCDHAAHDGLTGLYNKRELDNCLEREWRYACRYQKYIGILMIDVDHFKAYNDHYGHPAGDETLIKVANTISDCVFRGHDMVARYGGEEFVVILPNLKPHSLGLIADRIRVAVMDLGILHRGSESSDVVSVSVGGALTKAHADNNFMMLMELADKCLYQAKNEGRNRFQLDVLATPKY